MAQRQAAQAVEFWESRQKAMRDQIAERWEAQRKSVDDMLNGMLEAQRRAVDEWQTRVGGIFNSDNK
jgi:hypothetical protein